MLSFVECSGPHLSATPATAKVEIGTLGERWVCDRCLVDQVKLWAETRNSATMTITRIR